MELLWKKESEHIFFIWVGSLINCAGFSNFFFMRAPRSTRGESSLLSPLCIEDFYENLSQFLAHFVLNVKEKYDLAGYLMLADRYFTFTSLGI